MFRGGFEVILGCFLPNSTIFFSMHKKKFLRKKNESLWKKGEKKNFWKMSKDSYDEP
jgi:hypothetical protein